jgi:hypothetical protein
LPLRVIRGDASAHWQLQHGRQLTFAQIRQQDGFSVGKLKGIVMDVRPIRVDLSKLRHSMPHPPGEEHTSLASYLLLEGQLGAGKQTNGHVTIVDRGKTTCCRVGKARRYQLVSNLRGSGGDEI